MNLQDVVQLEKNLHTENMHFDWEQYQTDTGCELITQDGLMHHAAANKTKVEPGTLCELRHSDDKYWFAVIKLVCGPLLEISYIICKR